MKANIKKIVGLLLALVFILSSDPIAAQENSSGQEGEYITIDGVIRDQKSRRKIEYANISIQGTNIGTVSNNDGEFSIKVLKSLMAKDIVISHLGYMNSLVPVNGRDLTGLTVWMTPNSNVLEEIIVRAQDPRIIVEQAIDKIPVNYSMNNSMLTGFYRETAQKGRRYINISEAVIDIYKTSYKEFNTSRDRVQVFKGRKLLSQKVSDTLIVKLLGGPNLSTQVDIVKNPDLLLDRTQLQYYSFKMEEAVMLDNRQHYVIRFTPQMILPYALYKGRLFIDKEKMSFTRAEFSLDMDDLNKATDAILKRKPAGLRFRPVEVTFLVNYKDKDEQTVLSYIRNEVRFRCDWKRRLFATNYTITSEMVVTDGKVAEANIPYSESFKLTQSLSDKVVSFYDEDFWGAYNIIEPTESLESAVGKLIKQRR